MRFNVMSIPTLLVFKDGEPGEAPRRRQGQGPAAPGPRRVRRLSGAAAAATASCRPSSGAGAAARRSATSSSALARARSRPRPRRPRRLRHRHTDAVRARSRRRGGLRVDGVVGRQTWSALVESGFALGDRLLYFRRPMLRGDDVAELQRRLNALGFDAGREDGILGAETHERARRVPARSGLRPDGICGPTTLDALERVGSFADGSVASLRERERLLAGPRHLAGRRVYVAAAPGLAALGEQVAKSLVDAGADAVLDASGEDDTVVADEANRFGADLFLALRTGDAPVPLRLLLHRRLPLRGRPGASPPRSTRRSPRSSPPPPRSAAAPTPRSARPAWPRSSCDVVADDDVEAMRTLVARAGDTGRAIVRGIQHAVEHPDPDVTRVHDFARTGAGPSPPDAGARSPCAQHCLNFARVPAPAVRHRRTGTRVSDPGLGRSAQPLRSGHPTAAVLVTYSMNSRRVQKFGCNTWRQQDPGPTSGDAQGPASGEVSVARLGTSSASIVPVEGTMRRFALRSSPATSTAQWVQCWTHPCRRSCPTCSR